VTGSAMTGKVTNGTEDNGLQPLTSPPKTFTG
jgi:hypothetical protein